MTTNISHIYSKRFIAGLMLPLFVLAGMFFAAPKPAEASAGYHHPQPLINVGSITCSLVGLFCPAKVIHVHQPAPKPHHPKPKPQPTYQPTPYPTHHPKPTHKPCSSGCNQDQSYGWPRSEYQNPFGVSYGKTSWW